LLQTLLLELTAPPDPLAGFKRPTSEGGEGEEEVGNRRRGKKRS